MDMIIDSDSVDMGSIPVRDGTKSRLHPSVVRLQSVILLKRCFFESTWCTKNMEKTVLGAFEETLLPGLHEFAYND